MARILNAWLGQASVGQIASNSLDINLGDLVSLSGWYVIKAIATGRIAGVSKTDYTFASNNQTVAKREVNYVPSENQLTVELTADATITQADVDSYFNINADGTVDVATKTAFASYVNTSDAGSATDAVVYKQLKLVRVITSTLGEFAIINY